ncbi:hypothetical protein AOLI_G00163160 [Acnodon oligacanthus]
MAETRVGGIIESPGSQAEASDENRGSKERRPNSTLGLNTQQRKNLQAESPHHGNLQDSGSLIMSAAEPPTSSMLRQELGYK